MYGYRGNLIDYAFVIPAYAGIHKIKHIDSGFRQNDGLVRGSLAMFLGFLECVRECASRVFADTEAT